MSRRRDEEGFSLVMLMGALTIMLILMAAGVPSWKYVVQDDKEQELLSRGGQIADAIQAYQTKNGGTLPTTLDVLVKGHFLRRAYKDPMTKDGVWRYIHQGEPVAPTGTAAPGSPTSGGLSGLFASPSPSPTPSSRASSTASPFGASGTTLGPFLGVASKSKMKSFRLLNNAKTYDTWLFVAGQQRIVGKTPTNAATGPGGAAPQGPGAAQGGAAGAPGMPPAPGTAAPGTTPVH